MKLKISARRRLCVPIFALATAVSTLLIAPAAATASSPAAQTPAAASASATPARGTSAPTTPAKPASNPPAPAKPAPAKPAPAASAASSAIPTSTHSKCGGQLAFGEVAVCSSISGDDQDVFTVTSKVDGDILYTMFPLSPTGDLTSASVTDSSGNDVCFIAYNPDTCKLGIAGVYTITVSLYYGSGSGNYSLSVESQRTPSACKSLSNSFFSFASPGLTATTVSGAAVTCFSFDQALGSVLYTDNTGNGEVEGPILDAQYQPVCYVRYATTCTLGQPGPYHLFLFDDYGYATAYTLRMPRLSASAGCGVVRPGGFGDQQTAAGTGTVSPRQVTCNKLKASAAGQVAIRFDNDQNLAWTLYDNAGKQICDKFANANSCPLPAAGDYTLLVLNQGYTLITYQVGATALYRNAGCAAATGTSWGLPALVAHQTSATQLNCQLFEGQAGDRIAVYDTAFGSLVDSTGAAVCPAYSDQDGCVLPATGTYRVVSHLWTWNSQVTDATYKLQIRRLSAPQGCPTVSPGAYNAAPAGALGGIRCRILDIPAAGSYLVRPVDAQNYDSYGQVYDAAGVKVCNGTCDFTAPGRYTMVLDGSVVSSVIDNDFQYAVALLPGIPTGCSQAGDDLTQLTPHRGEFTAAGQYDCLQLASPAGARIMELRPENATGAANPAVTVFDAAGNYVCDSSWGLRQQSCELTGTAPFFAVYKPNGGTPTGTYALEFPRVDGAPTCSVLPATADGATVDTNADGFAGCFSVPADQHSTKDSFTFQRISGSGVGGLAVFDSSGILYCGNFLSPTDHRTSTCTLPAGPLTVIVESSAVDSTYQVTYADASTTSP